MSRKKVTDELMASELAAAAARFPDRPQVVVRPEQGAAAEAHYWSSMPTSPSPAASRQRDPRPRPHRFIEGCLITRNAIDCTNCVRLTYRDILGPYAILVEAPSSCEAARRSAGT